MFIIALEVLNKLGLVCDNGMLNNTGWYLLEKKPLTIKEAISYIQNHISYKSNIVGIQREDISEIPLRAIREIVINSFAHCCYARKGNYNSITIFKSLIRIYNPGSILNNIVPKRFASGASW